MKKLLFAFCSLLFAPMALFAASPIIIGAIVGVAAIAGFSIFRSVAPINIADAMNFFSSCWSCQLFGTVMQAMSDLLPRVYDAIGGVIIPVSIALTAIWFAWKLFSGYINAKPENAWGISGTFGHHLVKLGIVVALLSFPLPRLITTVVIEPVFTVGLSLNQVVAGDEKFNECLVATTLASGEASQTTGAYSPKLRNNLACEIANVHQLTAVGMTSGWTMINMAFNSDYMYKVADAPVFPNVPIFFAGLLVLALFIAAVLPIPFYFLEIFISLSLNLIMLPMYLLGWLFKDFKEIIPGSSKSIESTISDVVKGAVGIALIGIFLSFAIMFLDAMFGQVDGISALAEAFTNNDPSILMDGLVMNNTSLVTIIMMGLFVAMFMNAIPVLIKTLFNSEMSQKTVDAATTIAKTTWDNSEKIYSQIADAIKKK